VAASEFGGYRKKQLSNVTLLGIGVYTVLSDKNVSGMAFAVYP
jgi:hypothetical protein